MDVRDSDILNDFARKIIPEMQAVSKRFAPSFEYGIDGQGGYINLTILASKYIRVLIDGRAPTGFGAKKGSPTLQQIIFEWIKEKGIVASADKLGKIPSPESLSWAISKSIHMHGTIIYQQGGGNNIFDSIITDSRINNLLNLFSDKYLTQVTSELINTLENGK